MSHTTPRELPPSMSSPAAMNMMPCRRSFLGLGLSSLLVAATAIDGQFIDGGVVDMRCDICACEGTTDDGQILVYDNPSTGSRVVSLDEELSEIAETTCGASIFATGNTIYELSGVDLVSPEFEAVDMSGDEYCSTLLEGIPADSDCNSGVVEKDFGNVIMTTTICLCLGTDSVGGSSSTFFMDTDFQGDGVRSVEESNLCSRTDFFSVLMDVIVEGEKYSYNFELSIPGMAGSADLSVASAPGVGAQAFSCGDLSATASPSASPTLATASPVSLDDGTAGTSGASSTCAGGGLTRVAAIGFAWALWLGAHSYL